MQIQFPTIDSQENVYVIDTSGLIALDTTFPRSNPAFTAIWEEIEDLIEKGQFKIIDFVEKEINDYEGKEDFLRKWVKQHKASLVCETDAESINAAKPIINQEKNTGFLDKKKQDLGKEEADPYLIGYCKVHNCILITNESPVKPNKIPQVAGRNNVRCINIYAFLVERGLKMERRKNH